MTTLAKGDSMFQKVLGLVFLVSIISCGKKADDIQPKEKVRASNNITDSFGATGKQFYISKSALEKEFLLQGALIPQPNAAMGSGIKSHVVAFRHRGENVYLIEANQGHTVATDLPQNMILAEFPVITETADKITFDFNKGMSAIFSTRDWYGQDFGSIAYDAANTFTAVKVNHSYIESADMQNDKLVIRQIAQVVSPAQGNAADSGAKVFLPVEVRYYISPYAPNPDFKPTQQKSYNFDRMGFFEVAPYINDQGMPVVRASKFDHKKGITFAVSANTPIEFKNAIREGILYWNKAFGSEVIKAIDAPVGVTAPDINYNVVQWVPWNLAGFAYADAQMDPRSGEILHAQVFLTSAFAFGGKINGRMILQNLKSTNNIPSALRMTLKGFGPSQLCTLNLTEQLEASISSLVASGASDEKILKAAQDYVREVTAHEIGHTLGLRHNFAGSLASNIAAEDRSKVLKAYFETGSAPSGVVTSSSAMEYQVFDDSIIAGDQAAKDSKAFAYDEVVIQTLYNGKKYADRDIPLFCTDSHKNANLFADCQTFDYTGSHFEWVKANVETQLREIPFKTFMNILRNIRPVFGEDATPVEKVSLMSAAEVAKALLIGRDVLVNQFTNKGGLLKIQRKYPSVNSNNRSDVRIDELNYVAQEIARLGGLSEIIPRITSDQLDLITTRFNSIADSNQVGVGADGKPYVLSDTELDAMKTIVNTWVKAVKKEISNLDLQILNQADLKDVAKFADHSTSSLLVQVLVDRAKHYIFSTTQETIDAEVDIPTNPPTKASVKLPKFDYSQATRMLAAGLLRDGRGEAIDWAFTERNSLKTDFSKLLEGILKTSVDKVKPEALTPAASRWVLENSKVLATVSR